MVRGSSRASSSGDSRSKALNPTEAYLWRLDQWLGCIASLLGRSLTDAEHKLFMALINREFQRRNQILVDSYKRSCKC